MRAKFLKEESVFKPKSKAEVQSAINDIRLKIEETNMRDEAIQMVANYTEDEFNNITMSIAEFISENEFNEALLYIVNEYLERKGIKIDES